MTPAEALRWLIPALHNVSDEQKDALREALAIVEGVQNVSDTFHTSHGAAWAAGYNRGHGDGTHDAQGWARRISINPWNGELAGRFQVVETGRTWSDIPNVSHPWRSESGDFADVSEPQLESGSGSKLRAKIENLNPFENVGADGYHPPFPGAEVGRFSELGAGALRGTRPNEQSLPRNYVSVRSGVPRVLSEPTDAELLARAAERGTPELGAEAYGAFAQALYGENFRRMPWETIAPDCRKAWRLAAHRIWNKAQ